MTTRIVFAGGAHVEVPLDLQQVKDALDEQGLNELVLPEKDPDGNPVRLYVNRDQIAFIIDTQSTERPADEPSEDELPDAESPPQDRQRVTDVWGNPVGPRRRKR